MILDLEREKSYMREAISLAKECVGWGDVPVGCVIVCQNEIVGRGQNRREVNHDATAHAEIMALRQASTHLQRWRLQDCQLYVSLEPCVMCMGGILQSKIQAVYFGAYEEKSGCCGSVIHLGMEGLGHKPQVFGGILQEECQLLLKEFFSDKR